MVYIVILLIVVLNALITVHVISDERRRRFEKVAETGLIWIIPVLGILVSICITLQGSEKVREYEDMGKFCYFSH